MDSRPPMPPIKPDFEAKPRASPVWLILTGFGAVGLFVLLAFLVTPILWVGVAITAIIGLQYLLWGWWFERIYRSGRTDDVVEAQIVPPKDHDPSTR